MPALERGRVAEPVPGPWLGSTVAKSKRWLDKVWAGGGFSFVIKVGRDPGRDVSRTLVPQM